MRLDLRIFGLLYYFDSWGKKVTNMREKECCPKGKCGCQYFILLTLKKKKKIVDTGVLDFLIKN
jgi:hypothetical protein